VSELTGDAAEVKRLRAELSVVRALLKQAHDRDKYLGEWPAIKWYGEVARYFQEQPL
jgi:hypothetical protein